MAHFLLDLVQRYGSLSIFDCLKDEEDYKGSKYEKDWENKYNDCEDKDTVNKYNWL